ncbi:hypothetical protein [Streptomyces sp. URMC 129]|uniref:hypothetical protein n=1 Tax=Streptomyces sp. URMC 129 TaxID=3423407 RepID=UPI003F1C7837
MGWGEPQRGAADGDGRGAATGAPRPEEKKTETTLTTRARINIPGSRPIPPIVVRETVEDPAGRDAVSPPPARPAAPVPAAASVPAPAPAADPAGGPGKKTSSWFEPKKPPEPRPGGPDTPAGGHPAVAETPADGIPASWFRQHPETPAAGTPYPGGMPPGPAGPTTGPATGAMPVAVPPAQPVRPVLDEDPAATTMDLGGPFPPAPPADVTATGPTAVVTDPHASGATPRVAVPPPGPRPPAAAGPAPEPEPAPAAPKRKNRGRLLRPLVTGVVGVSVIAYGAGLFLSPEDVPKGTTILGIDIGGLDAQDALNRLDAELERANNTALTLLIDGQEVELKPSVAGLAVDTEATVRASSGQDYSPVSVIGSLFGAERTQEAVFAVDREKLTVALEDITTQAGSGGPVEGTVVFENGEAIGRPGEPGTAVDVEAAADVVEAAFRERAATGRNPAIELPVTAQEPRVGEAQVRQALEEFGEPAMSGWVWLVAAGIELPISPETLDDFLSMRPGDTGTLQPVIDMEVLAQTYGSTFDGVMIDAGAGPVPMAPEHAAAALIPALRETATTDQGEGRRVAEVEGATLG